MTIFMHKGSLYEVKVSFQDYGTGLWFDFGDEDEATKRKILRAYLKEPYPEKDDDYRKVMK